MTGWLQLTDEQRRTALEQAAVRSGILREAIEKDWWVTLVLKALFELPYAGHFIFKGGTSLSKGWQLIQRISEDIDIALAPEAFGEKYMLRPSHSYVKKLKKEGFTFTTTEIRNVLEAQLSSYGLKSAQIEIAAAPMPEGRPDTDPQTIFVNYHSLYPRHSYIENQIRIEFSVRSQREPFEAISVQSLLWRYFPNEAYNESSFTVRAASPRKTFLEKVFLLHEKFTLPVNENIGVERQSRHLYDLVKMAEAGIIEDVLNDKELYNALVAHRRYWIRFKGINYDKLQPATLSFVPPEALMERFREDYQVMLDALIYQSFYDFETLILHLRELNDRFNKMS